MDLALNNLQRLICQKTKTTKQPSILDVLVPWGAMVSDVWVCHLIFSALLRQPWWNLSKPLMWQQYVDQTSKKYKQRVKMHYSSVLSLVLMVMPLSDHPWFFSFVCVCVCVWERERERELKNENPMNYGTTILFLFECFSYIFVLFYSLVKH